MPPAKLTKLVWQDTQSAVVAMWLAGFETGVTPAKAWPLWQVVHPDEMPVWFIGVAGRRPSCSCGRSSNPACRNVVGGLADHAARAGVAAGAARGDARVIERTAREAHEARVAGHAIGRRRDVVGGLDRGDAGEGLAIVAGGAPGRDARVVHRGAGEGRRAP